MPQALLDYCNSGLDIGAYWSRLQAANITKERLSSFDRCSSSSRGVTLGNGAGQMSTSR